MGRILSGTRPILHAPLQTRRGPTGRGRFRRGREHHPTFRPGPSTSGCSSQKADAAVCLPALPHRPSGGWRSRPARVKLVSRAQQRVSAHGGFSVSPRGAVARPVTATPLSAKLAWFTAGQDSGRRLRRAAGGCWRPALARFRWHGGAAGGGRRGRASAVRTVFFCRQLRGLTRERIRRYYGRGGPPMKSWQPRVGKNWALCRPGRAGPRRLMVFVLR